MDDEDKAGFFGPSFVLVIVDILPRVTDDSGQSTGLMRKQGDGQRADWTLTKYWTRALFSSLSHVGGGGR
jgi:hypothetical protein